ncbi:uncharacterized protein LOC108914616 [Anoplophora glabripennis]|uniref:uncharacterized protein LOC108914616 n=1 Tax=Anoplophora glabripennis TaxID=217634 RepID=UPI0008745DAA|nr:uncharacterized protein LOC108914616 [Anoplophora glabripennis]
MATKKNYYTNPAFCQQSEFYNGQRPPQPLSPRGSIRQSPVGAQTPHRVLDNSGVQEQEFYEEVVVDDQGFIKEKKFVIVAQNNEGRNKNQNHRYEYIPMQEHDCRYSKTTPKKQQVQKEVEVLPGRSPNRYEYIQTSPKSPVSGGRYEYIQQPLQQRAGNPIATQKLHELLSTPKKINSTSRNCTPQKILSPQSGRKVIPPALSPKEFQIPSNSPPKIRSHTSKAQQKLNYALGTRQLVEQDKRHTAIVAPMCSSPIHSVYSETTYSNKSESWMNLSIGNKSVRSTLAVAALLMLLCGTVTSGLCFYMISIMGRLYFLDFGIVAGFTCLILGLLGFRTNNVYWLPNRNYISGYLVLSVFSLLTCVGLLVLLVMQPRPGTPLADITSGAVCGISVFSLILAVSGVVSSYCCKYPPPDNRVQHCAEGFTV